jgi:hypothetical protein
VKLTRNTPSAIVDPSFFTLFELIRQCPECLKWGSLELVETKSDESSDYLRVFRCTVCSKETVINHDRPPRAV